MYTNIFTGFYCVFSRKSNLGQKVRTVVSSSFVLEEVTLGCDANWFILKRVCG